MTPDAMYTVWGSGAVNRWHTHPHPGLRNAQDRTDGHAWRVAMLAIMLLSKKNEVGQEELLANIMAALTHDMSEVWTGDISSPFKKSVSFVNEAFHAANVQWFKDLDMPYFGETEMLRLCDSLDAYLTVCTNAPDLAGKRAWRRAREQIIQSAWDLGHGEDVEDLIYEAEKRDWF